MTGRPATDPGARTGTGDGARVSQWVVRGGLAISSALMLVGFVVRAVEGGRAEPVRLTETLSTALLGDRILMLGALALAITPALQIVMLAVAWARIRDDRFTAVAVIVLAVLVLGAILGHG